MAFPVKYVPEWVPGAGFQKIAKKWRKLQEAVVHGAYDMVVEQQVSISADDLPPSAPVLNVLRYIRNKVYQMRHSWGHVWKTERKTCQRL